MRVAAIYDIHGNLPALESVLIDIEQVGVDHIVVGGDILPGPQPQEVLDRLMSLTTATSFIYGNGEREVLALLSGKKITSVPEQYHEGMLWGGHQLDSDQHRIVSSWPSTVQLHITGLGEVLFCHATPRNDYEIFTRITPEEQLETAFENVDLPVVICGHTHMQFDRSVGQRRVVNAGSVGMPFGKPGAYWVMLGPDVELRYTSYDLVDAAERIRATAYPEANDFATGSLLNPPSEDDMMALFESVAIR